MRLRTGVAAITGDPIPLIRRAVLDRVLRDDVGGAQSRQLKIVADRAVLL